jgi:hypothetical protein
MDRKGSDSAVQTACVSFFSSRALRRSDSKEGKLPTTSLAPVCHNFAHLARFTK